MGTVYLAEHALLGRRAAIKLLHPRYSHDASSVERFFNEARAATSIADPGIVQIFDFGYHETTAYIVMEFLQGESLGTRLARLGRLPAGDVLRLARQLALSLFATHQRGVIHRDLKPDNIFIVGDAEVAGGERTKILDFGIAKLTDDDRDRIRTQTGMMMGTPTYMSPEQCRGLGQLDHRADIYSLGCVIFHLLTGRVPFEAAGTGDLIVAHLQETPPAPSQLVPLTPAVDALVARCLAKSPGDRFATMRALAAALDDALRVMAPTGIDLARLTPMPAMSPAAPTIRDPAPRRRWPLALVAVAAIAGAIILALSLRSTPVPASEPPPPPPAKPIASVVASPPAPPPDAAIAADAAADAAITRPAAHPHPPRTLPTKPGPAGSATPRRDPYDDR